MAEYRGLMNTVMGTESIYGCSFQQNLNDMSNTYKYFHPQFPNSVSELQLIPY